MKRDFRVVDRKYQTKTITLLLEKVNSSWYSLTMIVAQCKYAPSRHIRLTQLGTTLANNDSAYESRRQVQCSPPDSHTWSSPQDPPRYTCRHSDTDRPRHNLALQSKFDILRSKQINCVICMCTAVIRKE